jgi:hypothetical protein
LNIGKAVDKIQGNEREVVGANPNSRPNTHLGNKKDDITYSPIGYKVAPYPPVTKGSSEFEGWGTALKPANEPICVARKPLSEKSVAENVLKWGTGGINVDGCRVGTELISHGTSKIDFKNNKDGSKSFYDNAWQGGKRIEVEENITEGRFPANIIFECLCDEVIKGEEWRTITNYDYEVSNLGNVRNKDGIILKTSALNSGYLQVQLSNNGEKKNMLIHRLVADAFIKNDHNKKTVNHKDGDKSNNKVDNLEWMTYSENNIHAIENNLRSKSSDKPVGQYDLEGNLINEYKSATEAAKMTGVMRSKISAVCVGSITKGKTGVEYTSKTAGGFVWKHIDDCVCNQIDSQSTNASRFFYQAKVSKAERNMGLDGFEEKENNSIGSTYAGNQTTSKIGGNPDKPTQPKKNSHPTLKPVNLMTYLCRLVTPTNGIILDPFMGSGSTGIAAQLEGFRFCGMEMDSEYFKIAEARIENFEKYRKFIKK